MANKKITELPTGSNFMSSTWQEGVEGGINVKFSPQQTNPFRGTWAGTNAFPATGGRYTSGVPAIGDMWILTDTLTIGSDVYSPGSIILALTNTPGQTRSNWAVLAVQL